MIDTSILLGKRAAYFTLGCKLNFAETSSIGEELSRYGVQRVKEGEQADLCVVNTCSVTEVADQKCRQAIHRMVRRHPGALVVVTGCYAQLQPQMLEGIDGVDLVIGAEQKQQVVPRIMEAMSLREEWRVKSEANANNFQAPSLHASRFTLHDNPSLHAFFPSCSRGERTRFFLKVQDGCNYFCTYCTIPMARGRSRNGSISSLVAQAEKAASEGGQEIVITGVNIGDFGRSTGETFLDLIRQLDSVEGISRYRISSIEPNLLSDEIIDFVAHSRAFMPHFHIPLQSGSDAVLRLMHRRYGTELFRHRVEHIKELMPHAFIGVDVIVGTRGETQELFEESYRFLESLPVSQLHVFSYSERPGTKALEIPHVVTPQDKHERSQRLLQLSEQKRLDFYRQFIGTTRPVLLEHSRGPLMHGFTDNYIRVELPTRPDLSGTIQPIHLGQLNRKQDALVGKLA